MIAMSGARFDAAAVVAELDARLRAAGTPERAEHERRYLKSQLAHYGAPVGAGRAAARDLRRHRPDLAREDLLRVARLLWSQPSDAPVHERRLLAALLLEAYLDALDPGDLDLIERWVREARTWALVDVLAADVAGRLADRFGTAATPLLDRWARDGDVWVRRAALLAHLRALRSGGGEWERFAGYADGMLAEREFWIRKAIGWVLRDTARRRPDLVFAWLLPRASRASGLTVREAVKHLPPQQAAAVRAAHRPKR